jgi:transcriptional regulator with XRE-family HTH domain
MKTEGERVPPKRVLGPRTPRLGALGRAIEQERKAAGLSQEELASRSGIHATHVSGLERGARNPTYETLQQVADGLGGTVGQLTGLADEIYSEGASR